QDAKVSVVSGTVTDEKGDALLGVTIEARNTTTNQSQTLISDEHGKFAFSALTTGNTYTFTFSYIGYDAQKIESYTVVQNARTLDVKLKSNSTMLNQVVV